MSTVALTIDYSNGAQKHFSSIPWKKGLTILDAIEASKGVTPGIALHYGSSRNGQAIDLVIDGVPSADGDAMRWVVWVNAKAFPGSGLGTETSFGFNPEERQRNLLNPKDHVLVKLSLAAE